MATISKVFTNLNVHYPKNSPLDSAENGEFGFYVKSKIPKIMNEIFVGLWVEYWKDNGQPVVVTYNSNLPNFKYSTSEFEKIAKDYPTLFERFHFYNDLPVLVFTANAIYNQENHKEIVKILYDFAKKVGI